LPRADWQAYRLGLTLGASDAPALLACNPWWSILDLYAEKRAALAPDPSAPPPDPGPSAERMHWGKVLEPAIVDYFRTTTGLEARLAENAYDDAFHVWHDAWMREHEDEDISDLLSTSWMLHAIEVSIDQPFLHATLDGIVTLDDGICCPLEVKNVSQFMLDEWVNEPPLMYQVQVQHQLGVTGAPFGYLAALVGGATFRWAKIERDETFIAALAERAWAFIDCVNAGRPPDIDASPATNAALRRLHPNDNGATIALSADLSDWDALYVLAKKAIKQNETQVTEAENHIIAAIGDATYGTLPNGTLFSYKTQTRGSASFRVLRRKEKK
jgi:predicted phage-related endonuclease